ncbi:MAG TPA: branched-chain amino acid ABC transporter permease [Aurantimonas sp.]|uniref:Branched-chain amino acid ABC transporter permease n=1 Tax=Aurantimonas marianensis TaxID=2920428 RepID=A0A9X2H7T8_9HYPH|nr:branched-chain amino acid ABC transporter permease [Aurantimonas marianensis]MCP3054873.1 branched-chain amino acid ABC transporter permease [Aurantimonas marianensis]
MTNPQVTSVEPNAIRDGEGSVEGSPARQAGQRDLSTAGLIVALIALAGLLAAPFFFYPVFIMKVLCFALFATAFNLLLGYVGLLSFGHAAFFGGAAYFTAHAAKVWGWEPLSAILLGAVGAGLIGLVVGFLAIRRQGIYFAMVTLALSQMIFFIFLQAPFTHGEDGIQGVPRGHLLGLIDLNDPLNIYYFVLAIFLFGFFAVWRIVNSPFGHILKAIRENENRAISLGYRVERYKLGAFVMSAAIAGLAGSTKAIVFQIATLTDVAWQMSGEVVLMTLLGGMGTIFGPTVGAALVVIMQNYFATSDFPVTVLIGIIFVLCVLLFRRGIVGEAIRLLRR